MGFKTTEWEFSKEVDNSTIPAEEGEQFLQIIDASYNEEDSVYKITVQSLLNSAEFNLNYWLKMKNDKGEVLPNRRDRGTLITLGRALAGKDIGIPFYKDIIGGIVKTNIKYSKPSVKTGATYPKAYEFYPIPEDIATMSLIDQYYVSE